MTFRILGVILLFSTLSIAVGCHAETKPIPAVPVALEELAAEWKANREATLGKYKGRILEISGNVSMATNDTVNLPMVRIADDNADRSKRVSVRCLFLSNESPRINRLCEGQTVTVRGQFIDADSNEATLLNCELVETGDGPAITLSPHELAKEYKADKDETAKKYNSRWVIVEGFVDAIDRPKVKKFDMAKNTPPVEVEDEHCYRYFFKSDDKTVRVSAVCCSFHNNTVLKKYAAVVVGQKIKVRGRCDKTVWREAKMIELTQGVLLDD